MFQVVLLDLEVLAEVSSSSAGGVHPPKTQADVPQSVSDSMKESGALNTYFAHFMVNLLKLFATDRQLLEDRGPFIIRLVLLSQISFGHFSFTYFTVNLVKLFVRWIGLHELYIIFDN